MRTAILACLLLSVATAAWAHSYVGSGTVTLGNRTLKAKSAIAVWTPENDSLRITFFPFQLTKQQLEACWELGATVAAGLMT